MRMPRDDGQDRNPGDAMSTDEVSTQTVLTELYDAIVRDDQPEFDRLIAQSNLTKEQINTPLPDPLLCKACMTSVPHYGLKLIELGHGVNVTNSSGQSPLPLAAAWQSGLPLVEALVHAGADASHDGSACLQGAALQDNAAMINLLIEHGAKVNDTDFQLWTALHWAMHTGCLKAAKALIEAGANINALEENGFTPAGRAAWSDVHDEMLWLIAKGCQPTEADLEKDDKGLFKLSPSEAAARGGHCDLLVKMIDEGKIDTTDEQVLIGLREQAKLGEKTEALAFLDAIRAQSKLQSIIKLGGANAARIPHCNP